MIAISRSDPSAGWSNVHSLWPYWFASLALWGGLSLIARRANAGEPFSYRSTVMLIVTVAIAARVLTISTTRPQLSDDMWRYLDDGRMLARGVNPYKEAPAVREIGSGIPVQVINHPQLVTVYQPASQYVFVTVTKLHGTCPAWYVQWDPWGDRLFRLMFVLFDLVLIAMILVALRGESRSPWWAALYAWHPLAISETGSAGHQDVIGIALLFTSLWLVSRLLQTRHLWYAIIAGLLFAAAIAVKPVIAPLAVLIVWHLRRQPAAIAIGLVACVGAGAALYLPFVNMDGGMEGAFETADTFVREWAFNSSVHAPLSRVLMSKLLANFFIWALLALILVISIAKEHDLWRGSMVFLFASLLLSSTAHPWYLLWALALLPMRFNIALWVWSLTIGWSYAVLIDPAVYRVPIWVGVIEFLPVYALLIYSPGDVKPRQPMSMA
jgi:hypothetical protein